MTADDWPEVEAIYAEGIATGDATFETEPPSWEESRRPARPLSPRRHRGRSSRRLGGAVPHFGASVYPASSSIRSTSRRRTRAWSRPCAHGALRRERCRARNLDDPDRGLPRTQRAWRSTNVSVSASSATESESPSSTVPGETRSCSSCGSSEQTKYSRSDRAVGRARSASEIETRAKRSSSAASIRPLGNARSRMSSARSRYVEASACSKTLTFQS